MYKEELIKELEEILEAHTDLYNNLGNGDYTFKRAGKLYDQLIGFPTIQVLAQTLTHLKEEK